MLPQTEELLTDKDLREATTAQLEDLRRRVNLALRMRGKTGTEEKPSQATVYGNLEDLKVYTFTDMQFEAYRTEQDPQKAVAALGVELQRLTEEGLQKSDGSIERYVDFDRRLRNSRNAGRNRFTL